MSSVVSSISRVKIPTKLILIIYLARPCAEIFLHFMVLQSKINIVMHVTALNHMPWFLPSRFVRVVREEMHEHDLGKTYRVSRLPFRRLTSRTTLKRRYFIV